jgi:hypothetical protein
LAGNAIAAALEPGYALGVHRRQLRCRGVPQVEDLRAWEASFEATWAAHLAAKRIGGRAIEILESDGAWGVLKRVFLRAMRLGVWGVAVQRGGFMAVADALTAAGFPTVKDDVTYAGRSKSALVEGCVAVLPETAELLRVILRLCPTFEYERAFRPDRLSELNALLATAPPQGVDEAAPAQEADTPGGPGGVTG